MPTIFETLSKIENTSSSLKIQAILQNHKDTSNDDFMEKCLDIAMNPYRKFYINKLPNIELCGGVVLHYNEIMEEFFNLINQLETRKITGNASKQAVKNLFDRCAESADVIKYLSMIIKKHLNIGLGRATVNKVYPGLLKSFNIQLCTTYDSKKHSLENTLAQKKYNGYRCIARFNNITNEWDFISRNGKLFPKANLTLIEKELNDNTIYKEFVFDGELDAGNFNLSASIAMTETQHPLCSKLIYRMFDIIPINEWDNKKSTQILEDRLKLLHGLVKNDSRNFIYAVETVYEYNNGDNIDDLIKYMIESGGDVEGAVFKKKDSFYNFDRDNTWLRIKPFSTQEFEIVAINRGQGKYANTCGSITVKGFDDQTNKEVNANVSGIKDDIKDNMWNNQEKYIGKYAEIEYQYVTPDGSLRHPNFVRMREKYDE